MRRFTAIFLVVCLCLNLTGCGSSKEKTGENSTSEEAELSPDEALEQASRVVRRMSLRQKIGQMFLVDLDRLSLDGKPITEATEELIEVIEKYELGGVVLDNENILSAEKVKELNKDLSECEGIPMYIGTEEEGGGNKSIAANNVDIKETGYTSPGEMGQNMTEEQLQKTGEVIAEELSALGFNLNFAPTADVCEAEKLIEVNAVQTAAVLSLGPEPEYKAPSKKISKAKRKKRQRAYQKKLERYQNNLQAFIEEYTENEYSQSCFSTDEDRTAEAVEAIVTGMRSGKVATVLKTFPSISTVVRYHKLMLMDVDIGLSRLRRVNFTPFSAGIDADTDMIMAGHVSMSKIDGDTPASLSETILSELLRQELKFEGIIITEQMDLPVITNSYTTEQAVIKSVIAGADMIYNPQDLDKAISVLENAVIFGEINDKVINQAVLRILQKKIMQGIYAPENK